MPRLRSRASFWWVVDGLLVATLLAVVAFPLAARATQADAGIEPATPAERLPPLRRAPAGVVRDVPLFVSHRPPAVVDAPGLAAALERASAALFAGEPEAGRRLLGIARSRQRLVPNIGTRPFPYPYRYPIVDPLLDRVLGSSLDGERAAAAGDLAALLVLASARLPELYPDAGPVAFALLDRARGAGGCEPQLNLAFLLSTDFSGNDDVTRDEFERAAKACPGDPTPLYFLGQFQLLRLVTISDIGQGTPYPERRRRVYATFRRLQQTYPGSAAGWAGEADTWLRRAYDVRAFEPFTARNRFRRALALYRRAQELSTDPTLAAGEARAEEGLAHFDAAVAAQRRALRAGARSARLQVALVAYLEQAHRFGEAAAANGRFLARASHLFRGAGLFPGSGALTNGMYENDADDPLSLGVDRLQPLLSVISPPPDGLGAGVEDVSFIPIYHEVFGVTGVDRWCRGWSWRRDLILANRPERALRGLPREFADPKFGGTCQDSATLEQVALAEAGRLEPALASVRRTHESWFATPFEGEPDPALAYLQDARQNLWRFAGNRPKALAVVREWRGRSLPYDREGEIRYLDGEFEAAAKLFETAARGAVQPIRRAEALLKAGTAAAHAGRFDDARTWLKRADEIASRLAAREDFIERPQAAYVSYNARVQLGDAELRARRYRAAVPHYEAAREREPDVEGIGAGRRLIRPEVLENNEALVLAHLGRGREALAAIERAVATDRQNPIFLENLGLVLFRLGRLDDAERAYRASLASDPTLFPSANDLGVILLAQGRLEEAAVAFRRAVGAQPAYATGWFNLGVALSRRGASHFLQAQGALARAFAADSGLRSHERKPIFDADPYFTTLDLSKPIPPDWEYAKSTTRAPVAVAGLVILLLLLRGARALGMELLSSKAQEHALQRGAGWMARLSRLGLGVTPLVAVAVTVGVVLWPLLRAGGAPWPEQVALGVGTLALVGLYLRIRARASVRHFTWAPALPLSIGAAALGLGYAPLPAATEHATENRRTRAASVVALGGAALVLLLLGRLTEVPLTRALGATALLMTSSVLTPVEPLDGAFVANGRAGLAASLGLLALAILLAVGVL